MRKVDPTKHEDKRREILGAAERCFLRDGFRGASISDICAEAHISPGHLYHYFASKEAIITMMTELDLHRMAARFEQMIERPNVLSALLAEFDKSVRMKRNGSKPALILEVRAEASRNPAIAKLLHVWHQRIQEMLAALIRKGQERGDIDPKIDPEPAAAVLFNVMQSAMSVSAKVSARDQAKVDELHTTLFRRFLAPPDGQSSAQPKADPPSARRAGALPGP